MRLLTILSIAISASLACGDASRSSEVFAATNPANPPVVSASARTPSVKLAWPPDDNGAAGSGPVRPDLPVSMAPEQDAGVNPVMPSKTQNAPGGDAGLPTAEDAAVEQMPPDPISDGGTADPPCADFDRDGICDGQDFCMGPGAQDQDHDGVCDGADKCEGFDDSIDADRDGIPDGCDRCPGLSDADVDRNGYPDACDAVLWEITSPMSQVSASLMPVTSPQAGLLITRGDGAFVTCRSPIGEISTTTILSTSTWVQIEQGTTKTAGSLADLTAALVDRWDPSNTPPSARVIIHADHDGKGFDSWQPIDMVSPIARPFTLERIVVTGFIGSDGAYAMTWQIRGH